MKSIFTTLIFCFSFVFSFAQTTFEIGAGYYQNQTYANIENPDRSDRGAYGALLFNHRSDFVNGMVEARYKSNNRIEATALAQINLLWFVSAFDKLNENDNRNVSLLLGAGYIFSGEFYNYMDIPADLRINVK